MPIDGKDNFTQENDNYTDLDDNYDGFPGNARISSEYAEKYHQQGEDEWTNLPENHTQIWLARQEREIAQTVAAIRGQQQATSRIHLWPDVGPFVIPVEHTYQAHLQLVNRKGGENLGFNPQKYQYFDLVIAGISGRHDLFDPAHPDYKKYEAVRDNLAVLRNDIMGYYMDDHSFDPGDEKFLPNLVGIAQELGEVLRNEKLPLARLVKPYLDSDLLNMQGDGAAYAYRHLLDRQEQEGFIASGILDIKHMLGIPTRTWGLQPIERTPFTDRGLSAPPPLDVLCLDEKDIAALVLHQQEQQAANGVEEISTVERKEAVDHGIIILRWLQNLQLADKSVEEMLEAGTPQEKEDFALNITQTLDHYTTFMAEAFAVEPELRKMQQVQAAEEAAENLSHSLKLLATLEKPNSMAQTQQISTDITQQPERWNELKGRAVERLVSTMKGGVEEAVSALQQQEYAQENAQDESAERALENAVLYADSQRRRKKKKKYTQSGFGGASQREIDLALRADDRATGQGRFTQRAEEEKKEMPTLERRGKAHATSQGRNFEYESHGEHAAKLKEQQSLHEQGDEYSERMRATSAGGKDIDKDGVADMAGEMTSGQKQQMQVQQALETMQQQREQAQAIVAQVKQQRAAEGERYRLIDGEHIRTGGTKGRNFYHDDHTHGEKLQDQKSVHEQGIHPKQGMAVAKSSGTAMDIDGDGIADTAGSMGSLAQRDLEIIRALGQTLAKEGKAASGLPPAQSGASINDQNFAARTEFDRNRDPGKPRQI